MVDKFNLSKEQNIFFAKRNLVDSLWKSANHELIRSGRGIVSIGEENRVEFGTKLIEYYEDDEKLGFLVDFIYDKCLDGII